MNFSNWLRILSNRRYTDDTMLMAESEEPKSLLMKVKEESEKVGLKLTFRKLRSWHLVPSPMANIGETVETMGNFILGGSKITVDGDCNHEIKKTLAPWIKSYDKPRQHIQKQRHTFANKGQSCLVKTMVFPVIMYRSESWTIKKVECRRIDHFEMWCWRRLFRVPWTARKSN